MSLIDRFWNAIFETDPPPFLEPPEDDEDDGEDPLVVTAKVIDDSISAAIAKMVGEFRTELDAHDAVGWSEATKLTRDFLSHQLKRLMPVSDDG